MTFTNGSTRIMILHLSGPTPMIAQCWFEDPRQLMLKTHDMCIYIYCQLLWKTFKSCWIAYFVCFLNHLTSVDGFLDISCLLLDPLAGEVSLQVKALSFSQLHTLAVCAEDNLSTIVEYWRRCAAATKDDKIRKKHEEDDDHPKGLPSGKHRKSSY